jgi:hypothetical protein
MAQAQLEKKRLKNLTSVGVQTGPSIEFCVPLCRNKRARFYYSQAYRDFVLAFNINRSKSFIIDRRMWKKLRFHLYNIDNELKK